MKSAKKIALFISLILGLMSVHIPCGQASEFNFSVTPIVSEYQIDAQQTYFDLQLKPDQETTVQVLLRNDTEREVPIEIAVNSATTNTNVVVEYGESTSEKDESLAFDLQDYVDYPEEVVLAPQSEQTVTFTVKMPNETFAGVLAGGITFKEKIAETNQAKQKNEQGLSIQNEYSYVVALLMRQELTPVAPNLKLNAVAPGQINARNVILATLQNDQKTYINQVAIQAQITKKGQTDVLYETDQTSLQIAPNTHFDFPISLEGQALKPGDYHLSMTVYGNKNEAGAFTRDIAGESVQFEEQWQFEQDFTIDGKTAKELNAQDVLVQKDTNWLYWLLGLILLLMLVIAWLVWRRKQQQD